MSILAVSRCRVVFILGGTPYGATANRDRDGFTLESVDFPTCWAFAPTLDAALADLARQVAPRLAAQPLPVLPPQSLDRRPDLRARFSQIVARALARP
jgi:hypothetical protein